MANSTVAKNEEAKSQLQQPLSHWGASVDSAGQCRDVAYRHIWTTNVVTFSGLPAKVKQVEAEDEWVQKPLPPPIGAGSQVFRTVAVSDGRFKDWLAPHDVRVYRYRR